MFRPQVLIALPEENRKIKELNRWLPDYGWRKEGITVSGTITPFIFQHEWMIEVTLSCQLGKGDTDYEYVVCVQISIRNTDEPVSLYESFDSWGEVTLYLQDCPLVEK